MIYLKYNAFNNMSISMSCTISFLSLPLQNRTEQKSIFLKIPFIQMYIINKLHHKIKFLPIFQKY